MRLPLLTAAALVIDAAGGVARRKRGRDDRFGIRDPRCPFVLYRPGLGRRRRRLVPGQILRHFVQRVSQTGRELNYRRRRQGSALFAGGRSPGRGRGTRASTDIKKERNERKDDTGQESERETPSTRARRGGSSCLMARGARHAIGTRPRRRDAQTHAGAYGRDESRR